MKTRDLIKILTVLYFGLVICLCGSFQTMKITENLLLNQLKEDKDKKEEDDSVLVAITNSLFFKVANEVIKFIMKILALMSISILVFF